MSDKILGMRRKGKIELKYENQVFQGTRAQELLGIVMKKREETQQRKKKRALFTAGREV